MYGSGEAGEGMTGRWDVNRVTRYPVTLLIPDWKKIELDFDFGIGCMWGRCGE